MAFKNSYSSLTSVLVKAFSNFSQKLTAIVSMLFFSMALPSLINFDNLFKVSKSISGQILLINS